ncbi:MAG: hypothetical protein WBM40_08990 [Thiohalocapsa sp.]
MDPRDEDQLDDAIERFARLMGAIESRQSRLESRLSSAQQLVFVAFLIVVASLSFMSILLSQQVPGMTAAITEMNGRFGDIADDMVHMERAVRMMGDDMNSLPTMVSHVDNIHGGVAFMSNDVADMSGHMAQIDNGVGAMEQSMLEMRQSFEIMEQNVARMGQDVNHMSQPMRMFNWMNPLR